MAVKSIEYDKFHDNNIIVSSIIREPDMRIVTYQREEIYQGDIKVISEFPNASERDSQIKEEVKVILENALQEHMICIS